MLTSALLAVIAALLIHKQTLTPAPVEEPVPSPPEQSHYAVFYIVCGHLEHVLVTSNPPMMANRLEPASQEMLDVMKDIPVERIIELRYVGPECFYDSEPRPPVEPI
jgi:hypothetical protein